MDFESNCGDPDDELQMFENTHKTKSIVVTNASIDCGTSDSLSLLVLVVNKFLVMLEKKLLLRKFGVIPLRCGIIMKRLV